MKGETAICSNCDKEFVKKMHTQVNCSQECSLKKGNKKAREKSVASQFAIMERDGFRCVYCGKSSIENDARLVLDHLIPQHLGGESIPLNLVTCCTECNCAKQGKMLDQSVIERIQNKIKETPSD